MGPYSVKCQISLACQCSIVGMVDRKADGCIWMICFHIVFKTGVYLIYFHFFFQRDNLLKNLRDRPPKQ